MASSPPSSAARLWRVAAIVLVFAAVGPPVGAIAFMIATAVIGMGKDVDLAGLTWIGLFALIYAAPLSYLIGVGPAAAVGLVVGIRQAYFGAITWWLAIVIGIVAGILFLVLSGQPVIPRTGAEGQDPGSAPVMIVTCLAATFVCWAIVRNRYYHKAVATEARA